MERFLKENQKTKLFLKNFIAIRVFFFIFGDEFKIKDGYEQQKRIKESHQFRMR